MKDYIYEQHQKAFKTKPELIVFAPGRVNFIGDHTDYNDGYVMPLALDKGIYLAVSSNRSRKLSLHSLDFNTHAAFSFSDIAPDQNQAWANCPKGVIKMLLDQGHTISGIDVTIKGDLPMGAGLSSSAATEVAVGFALNELFKLNIPPIDLALLCQKSEHLFMGTQCGIMDQFISLHGKKNSLIMLSCKDMTFKTIPLVFEDKTILITNSHVSHNLANSEYNTRRKECSHALSIVRTFNSSVSCLSDVTQQEIEQHNNLFPATIYKRALHVVTENSRVLDVAQNLENNNLEAIGKLLNESHASLRDNYHVSCMELDWLVANACSLSEVAGSRMTGGGFGGCTITLITTSAVDDYKRSLTEYNKKFTQQTSVYSATACNGATIL